MAIDLVAVLRLDDKMTANLKNVAGAATIGFAAITAAAAVSIKKFVDFDNAIRKTGAIAGANSEELKLLSESALDLGASTSKSATEVANAMTDLAAAGFSVNDVLSAMPGVIAASEASGESLATASETVGAALNIWSLKAEEATHVADVLAMAANVSAADITDLGYAFKYAGAPAAALGITLEETAAAVGLMTNAGIDGSSAGTALRASLLALNNPAKAQGKLMDKIGFSVLDAEGKFKSLSGIIGNLGDSLDGMSADGKVAILGKLVGTEAVSGVLSLISAGTDKLDEMTDALVKSDGAAAETASQMMGGIGGALEEMSGAIETVAIKVGERLAPALFDFARLVANTNFDPFINAVGLIGDAAGYVSKVITENWDDIAPILVPIAKVAAAIAGSFLLIGGAGAIFLALSAVIGFISGPIAAAALAVGALVGAFAVLYDKVAPFRKKVNTMFDGLKVALGFEVNTPEAPKAAGNTGATMLDEGNQAPQDVGYLEVASNITKAFKAAKEAVLPVFESIKSSLSTAFDSVKTKVMPVVENLKTSLPGAFTKIKEAVGTVVDYLRARFDELSPTFDMLKQVFTTVWDTVSSVLSNAWSIIEPILSGLWSIIQVVGEYATIVFNNIIAPALVFLSQLFATVWAIAQPILEALGVAFEVLGAAIKLLWDNILSPLIEFIAGGVKNAFEILTDALGIVQGAFETLSGKISGVFDKVREFADGLKNIKLPDWITNGVSTAVNFVGNALGSDKAKPGHYHGLANVPYDNYDARLHRGERVLTAQENEEYSNGSGGGGITVNVNGVNINKDMDIDDFAYKLAKLIEKERLQTG